MIEHLVRDRLFLKGLRLFGAVLAILGLGVGVLLQNHAVTLLGAWSAFCAFSTHKYLTGGEITAPGLHEDAASGEGKGIRLYVLLLWWIPLVVVLGSLVFGWLHG